MIDTSGITHNLKHYDWLTIFAISGLCYEDFLHDSVGSWEHFIEVLEIWDDVNQEPIVEVYIL